MVSVVTTINYYHYNLRGAITNPQNESTYTTTDIALAAYLHSEGFTLVEVDESSFPTKFFFDNSSAKLAECINLWERTKAEGNLFQF